MTAAAADRKPGRLGSGAIAEFEYLPVAASTKIYNGTMVAVNQSGYAVPASADSTLRVIGVAEAQADNSSGAAADINVTVRRGTFEMVNSATTDALSAADVGRPCFAVDDQTVARTNGSGARPFAGMVHSIDAQTSLVWVEIGVGPAASTGTDVLILAGEDLASDQFKLVKVGSGGTVVKTGAGEMPLGVVQNAPASGAVAIVRTAGFTRVKADGTGVTRGNPITSAASGVARATVGAASGLSVVDTGDAGAATDPVKGGYVIGIALETAAASVVFGMQITHAGAIATTAV